MLNNLKNNIDFFIREKTKFSRKNYKLKDKNNPESNYVRSLLTKYFPIDYHSNLSVLDIGSKNWSYVLGEYDYFKSKTDTLLLDGVELDAYRLYSNFYSRYEVAQAYIKGLENVNYYPENLLNIKTKYDYIIWLLPFVTEYPFTIWGLPKKFFIPQILLKHAYSLLKNQMLIINQTHEEYEIQENLLKSVDIKYEKLGEIIIDNSPYVNKRFGFIINK